MCELPDFLPPILVVDGIWEERLVELYEIFKSDFVYNACYYEGRKITFKRTNTINEKEDGFWHLISYENKVEGRIPDFKRAKRLSWVKAVIENHGHSEIKDFDYLEATEDVRKYLWLENHDFVVILEEYRNRQRFFLVTAFHVSGPYKRTDLEKKYEKRII